MRTISIKCGDSFSIWLKLKTGQTFPLNTNMLVYIGGVLIGNLDTGIPLITYESPYYKMNLSSEDTFPMRGYRDVIVVLDGTDGVRQVIIAGILFERLPTDYQTPTTNDGVNMIIELDVSTSPVTGSAELIDALKGDKGDPGIGVLPSGGTTGQVVTKLSNTEQDAGWRTPIQLGETSADSYRGDRGKIAYDHSQTPHAPADAEKNVNADWDSTSGDSQILNKPTIPSITGLATTTYVDQQDALKVDKVAGKQLSTNDYTAAEKDKLTAIQAGAQVNVLEGVQKNGVNLTITSKKVNVIVPTQPSDIGAQPAGNYATGGGTATGNNTGDNSVNSLYSGLVSNATHTGDVTGSTALTLATVNSNIGTFNNVTINAKGLATAGSNVSYEPSFSKNTAFNKNFGTTTGTVLEGRTFGTAANSAVVDFQPTITGLTTNYIPKWNGSSMVNSLISDDGSNVGIGTTTRDNGKLVILKNSVYNSYTGAGLSIQSNAANAYTELQLGADDNVNIGYIQTLQKNTSYLTRSLSLNPNGGNVQIGYGADQGYKLAVNGTGRFSSSVTAASFIGNGSNLTGVQLPITLTTNGTSGAATLSGNVLNVPNYTSSATSGHYTPTLTNTANIASSSIIADANYSRIGNIVTITLSANVTPTLIGTLTHLTFTLPITTVSTSQQYIGSGVAWFGSSSSIGTFSVESAYTAVFRFVPNSTSTSAVSGTFQYRID